MKAKGKTILRFAGLLEIIFGVATLALTFWILSLSKAEVKSLGFEATAITHAVNAGTFWQLALLYGTSALQIIGGLVGVLLANKPKKYQVCVVFGLILFVMGYGINYSASTSVLSYVIQLGVPGLYLSAAYLNKMSVK